MGSSMMGVLWTLLALLTLAACEGPEGPVGPVGVQGAQGEQGERGGQGATANIDELQSRVDSLDALITYALGGTPETAAPLDLGDTELRLLDPIGTDWVNFVTDTQFIGEVENTGQADALDVKIEMRLRVSSVAVGDVTRTVGTVRVGEKKIIRFTVDGIARFSSVDYSITYSSGGPFTGTVRVQRL